MHDTNTQSEEQESENYGDKVREQMDTTDMGAIMARFFNAVSWRED